MDHVITCTLVYLFSQHIIVHSPRFGLVSAETVPKNVPDYQTKYMS